LFKYYISNTISSNISLNNSMKMWG